MSVRTKRKKTAQMNLSPALRAFGAMLGKRAFDDAPPMQGGGQLLDQNMIAAPPQQGGFGELADRNMMAAPPQMPPGAAKPFSSNPALSDYNSAIGGPPGGMPGPGTNKPFDPSPAISGYQSMMGAPPGGESGPGAAKSQGPPPGMGMPGVAKESAYFAACLGKWAADATPGGMSGPAGMVTQALNNTASSNQAGNAMLPAAIRYGAQMSPAVAQDRLQQQAMQSQQPDVPVPPQDNVAKFGCSMTMPVRPRKKPQPSRKK